jgi:hypothetical protein
MHTVKFEADVMSPYIKFDAYQSFMNEHVEVLVRSLDRVATVSSQSSDNFKDYLWGAPKLDEPLNLERAAQELVLRDVFA